MSDDLTAITERLTSAMLVHNDDGSTSILASPAALAPTVQAMIREARVAVLREVAAEVGQIEPFGEFAGGYARGSLASTKRAVHIITARADQEEKA